MMDPNRNRVCPVELAGSLESRFRRWLHNPERLLAPFVKEGMHALDVGCGPGVFSLAMARMVGETGTVIAADLQEGMLERLRVKVRGSGLANRIRFVKCDANAVNVSESVNFILAFYMVHEVPDKGSFFRQLKAILTRNGHLLLVEPRFFHVSKAAFAETTRIAEDIGFDVRPGPRVWFSWSAVLTPM
jgi:ubiquinone/menaquinone biosynthesis C-methylase UbiE